MGEARARTDVVSASTAGRPAGTQAGRRPCRLDSGLAGVHKLAAASMQMSFCFTVLLLATA